MSNVDVLAVYLKQVASALVDSSIAAVSFDFRDLYFLNSSCLKAFVTWICGMVADRVTPFQITFVTNPKFHWQRRSVEALQRLAPKNIQIQS